MREFLIFLAVSIALYLIRSGLAAVRQKRLTGQQEKNKWEITPEQKKDAEECIRLTREDLESQKLQHFMLTDFQFKTQVTENDRQDMSRLQARLEQQLQELLMYLHLPPIIHIRVRINDPDAERFAGTFDWANKAINIYYKDYFDCGILNEVLCHECAHYFRYMHQLHHEVFLTEEKCTDMTACFMGCRQYMVNANNTGYLRPGQIRLGGNYLMKYREEHTRNSAGTAPKAAAEKTAPKKQQTAQTAPKKAQTANTRTQTARAPQTDSPAADRENLRRRTEAAYAMIRQARDIMAVKKVPDRTDLTEKDYAWLKQCTEKLDSGYYTRLLAQCGKDVQGGAGKVRKATEQATAVCGDISRLMWMFR